MFKLRIRCSMHGKMRNTYKISVGKPKGERPLGRPRYGWDDYSRMGLWVRGCVVDSFGTE